MQSILSSQQALTKPFGFSIIFSVLTAIASWVEVPMIPIPITMQTCVVLLSGALLGSRFGAISQILYLMGGLFLPIYAGGAIGVATLFGASGGYLLSFPIASYVVGIIVKRVNIETTFLTIYMSMIGVSLIVLILGTIWLQMCLSLNLVEAFSFGFVPFILGDLVKCGIVAFVIKADRWIGTHKPNLF